MVNIEDFNKLEKVLYTAVVADILDSLGRKNCACRPGIKPLASSMRIFGRVFTVLATDIYEEPVEPYKLEIEAVDKLKNGDVFVATTNGSNSSGFWGELLSTAAMRNGCRGAVIDGLARDQRKIIEMEFSTFVRGSSPYDSKGRTEVMAYQVPIVVGGVKTNPGDLILADIDGIVFIPHNIEEIVINKAVEKISGENLVRKEILEGLSIKEVFEKYNIL